MKEGDFEYFETLVVECKNHIAYLVFVAHGIQAFSVIVLLGQEPGSKTVHLENYQNLI